MSDDPIDTQAQRMPNGTPKPEGAAITPVDTTASEIKEHGGPMDRPGTEVEDEARMRSE